MPRQPAQLWRCQRWTGGSTGRRSRPRAVSPTRSSGCARRCRLQIAASSARQRGTTAPGPGVRPQHAPSRAVHLGLVCIQLSRRAESGLFAPMSKACMHVASCPLLFGVRLVFSICTPSRPHGAPRACVPRLYQVGSSGPALPEQGWLVGALFPHFLGGCRSADNCRWPGRLVGW